MLRHHVTGNEQAESRWLLTWSRCLVTRDRAAPTCFSCRLTQRRRGCHCTAITCHLQRPVTAGQARSPLPNVLMMQLRSGHLAITQDCLVAGVVATRLLVQPAVCRGMLLRGCKMLEGTKGF